MDFHHSDKVKNLQQRVVAFMDEYVYPAEDVFAQQMDAARKSGNAWQPAPVMETLKERARAAGLERGREIVEPRRRVGPERRTPIVGPRRPLARPVREDQLIGTDLALGGDQVDVDDDARCMRRGGGIDRRRGRDGRSRLEAARAQAARTLAECGVGPALSRQLRECLEIGDAIFAKGHLVSGDDAKYSEMNRRFHSLITQESHNDSLNHLLALNGSFPFSAAGAVAFGGGTAAACPHLERRRRQ